MAEEKKVQGAEKVQVPLAETDYVLLPGESIPGISEAYGRQGWAGNPAAGATEVLLQIVSLASKEVTFAAVLPGKYIKDGKICSR